MEIEKTIYEHIEQMKSNSFYKPIGCSIEKFLNNIDKPIDIEKSLTEDEREYANRLEIRMNGQLEKIMNRQKEAIADALNVEWTEEEWEKFRESHKNPNNC